MLLIMLLLVHVLAKESIAHSVADSALFIRLQGKESEAEVP